MWYPEIGETTVLTESTWMRVAYPIASSNVDRSIGDVGLAQEGGTLTVIANDTRHEMVLVEYKMPSSAERAAGSLLPSGALMLLSVKEVAEWESLEDCVRRLLREQNRSVSQ